MKKIIKTIMITAIGCLVALPSPTLGAGTTYEGISNPDALYNNIKYRDTQNHWAKGAIAKVSSFSLMKGKGYHRFYPNSALTREEALAIMVRLKDQETTAQRLGQEANEDKDTGNYDVLDRKYTWSKGYIETALNENILTQEEKDDIEELSDKQQEAIDLSWEKNITYYEKDFDLTEEQLNNIDEDLRTRIEKYHTWKKPATREEVAKWMARFLEIEPVEGDAIQLVYGMKDWRKIESTNIPIIEALLQNGIMRGQNNQIFNPKGTITRAEMVTMIDRVLPYALKQQGFSIKTGKVRDMKSVVTAVENLYSGAFTDMLKTEAILTMDDLTHVTIEGNQTQSAYDSTGFLVYKDNQVWENTHLNKGDYVKTYITSDNQVLLIEVLN